MLNNWGSEVATVPVPYRTVPYGTVPYGTGTVRYVGTCNVIMLRYLTVPYGKIPCGTVPYGNENLEILLRRGADPI